MSTDLQDIIVQSTIRAFNAGYRQGKSEGYEAGLEMAIEAAKFVQFDHYDLEVVALSDLEEELKDRANLYHSDRQITLSEQGQEGKS
jgi:hypothetical protein